MDPSSHPQSEPPSSVTGSQTGSNDTTGFSATSTLLSAERATDRRSVEYKDYRESFADLDHDDSFSPGRKAPPSRRNKVLQSIAFVLALLVAFWLGRSSLKFATPTAVSAATGTYSTALTGPRNAIVFSNGTIFEKPPGMKIIAIIFFGRRQFVDVLDCYLRRNLRVNGGIVDEVHFLMHTDVQEDKIWLKKLVKTAKLEQFYKLKAEDTTAEDWSLWRTFGELYRDYMTNPNAIYVKIDDDIVFVDDYAIPELVRTVLEHPEAHSIVSNNINNKWGYWLKHRTNSIIPYLPDADTSAKWPVDSWRPSELPKYKGKLPPPMTKFIEHRPPHFGHRWLPLEQTESFAESVSHTPWGPWLPNPMFHTGDTAVGWAVTAQAHYSLFENLENHALHKYFFGKPDDGIWNLWYSRYNINFFAIRGSHVRMRPIWGTNEDKGDETLLTETIPRELNMPVYIATRAITSHFSFRGDREMLLYSDVLDRYIAYANEMTCTADNQKTRFGPRLGPHHVPAGRKEAQEGHEGEDGTIGDSPSDIFNDDLKEVTED